MANSDVSSETKSDTAKTKRQTGRKGAVQIWQLAGAILLLGVVGLLGFAFWPEEAIEDNASREKGEVVEQAAEIDVAILSGVDFPIRVEATGHLQAWRSAEVSAEVPGVVKHRYVEEGQRVRAGTVLFELDQRDFEFEYEEARAEWLKMQAEYAVRYSLEETSANKSEVQDTTALAVARRQLSEAVEQFSEGQITVDELDSVRRRFEGLRIQSPDFRKSIQAANIGLIQAEQRKARAELSLQRTRITAPYAGRVADIMVEEGQRIGSGESVLTILDDSRMKVDVDVLEANIVQVKQGATARVRIPALSNTEVAGSIHSINPSIDPQTGAGRVTISIPNRQGDLIVGLFTYAFLEIDLLDDRLVLPAEAVLVRQGRDLVFRVEGNNAQWVYVDVGQRSGNYVEITDGLSAGDTIAVAGHFALAHDAPVQIKTTIPAFDEP